MAIGPLYRCFIEVARERGVDVAAIMREFELTEEKLSEASARLSPEVGRAFTTALIRAAQHPSFGLEAAQRFRLGDFGLLAYLARSAPDLSGVLTSASRYSRLLGDTAAFDIERSGDEVRASIARSGGHKLLYEGSDFGAAVFTLFIRDWIGEDASPRHVCLPRERPDDLRPYQRLFRCSLEFGSEHAILTYPASILEAPSRHADPQLAAILRLQAEDVVSKLPTDADLAARVRAQLACDLEQGAPDIARTARQLAMSERTLRRRLRELGTGFRALVDDVRRERALMLADQGAHSATEIAARVGFEDSGTFARSFRRWTGMLPRDYLLSRRRPPRT